MTRRKSYGRSPARSALYPDEELELWAFARYDLGLSDEEFWDLSVEQFNALIERHITEQENRDLRAAQICCVLANIHRDTRKKPRPFEIKDFLPQRRPKKPKTEKQMENDLTAVAIALGGEIK